MKEYSGYFRCRACRGKFTKPDFRRVVDEQECRGIFAFLKEGPLPNFLVCS